MRTVWKFPFPKFPFPVADAVRMVMPLGAQVLHVGSQEDAGCLWAEVFDTEARGVIREFRVFGTGHEIPAIGLKFIGTFFTHGQQLVWHVFEVMA